MNRIFRLTYALAIGAIVIFAVVYFADAPVNSATDMSVRNGNENVLRFRENIRNLGAQPAFAAFAEENQERGQNSQHEMAHWFGAALYAEEGADGLSVCDSRFAFGCYHEFLGQAIADLGLDSVVDLNEKCKQALGSQWLSCQHGIGHGVQTYFGYDRAALDEALAVCGDLPYTDPIGGCYGGVFMEYNVRTMLGIQAEPREFLGDPHEPCAQLGDAFKPACYYWQPQWWVQALYHGVTDEKAYADMGAYCNEIDDRSIRGHCYEGIGNITEQTSNRDPIRARTLCEAVSKSPGAQLYCKSVVANHFGIDVDHEAAMRVCEGLAGEAHAYCENHAKNTYNVMTQGPFPLSL